MVNALFKYGLRSLIRQRMYTLINILGLLVGLSAFMMIMLYVRHERNFDSFHDQSDKIYRLISHTKARSAAITPYVWAKFLKEELPEVEEYTTARSHTWTVRMGDDVFSEDLMFSVDSTFFKIFQFPVVSGNVADFLKEPNKVVITPELATKYFGDQDPIGQIMEVNVVGEFLSFEVQGVVECPPNSHLLFSMLLPVESVRPRVNNPAVYNHWRIHFLYTYLLMPANVDTEEMKSVFSQFLLKHGGKEVQDAYQPDLQPLRDIYLHSKVDYDLPPRGNAENNRILVIVAFGILLMAIINFINITSAQSLKRAREVGVRKVFGSNRRSLIVQFVVEATMVSLIAALLSFALMAVLIPSFNTLTGKAFEVSQVVNPESILSMMLLSLGVGIASGLYPALVLSSFKPIVVLRSRSAGKARGAIARKVLVIIQFALAVTLIISTGVIYQQVNYMVGKNLGFNKEQSIVIQDVGAVAGSAVRTDLLRQELLKNNQIHAVSASSHNLGRQPAAIRYEPDGMKGTVRPSISTIFADHDYSGVYDLELAQGRFFDRAIPTDSGGLVINEAALRMFASDDPTWLESPFTKNVKWTSFGGNSGESKVLGILKDFNFDSFRKDIAPLIFKMEPVYFGRIQIKLEVEDLPATLSTIQSTWKRLFPEVPMEISFIDQEFARHFQQEQNLSKILRIFALLSVIVGVLGLFGLASFLAIEKQKEMSIRKVTGASELQILKLLSWTFLKLIIIANAFALPLGIYLMNQWLNEFAFRIDMPLLIVIGATAISLLVTIFTVGYHSIKTARVNPARILAQE